MDSRPKSKINKFWQDKKIVMDPITTLKNILIKQIEKVKFIILFSLSHLKFYEICEILN